MTLKKESLLKQRAFLMPHSIFKYRSGFKESRANTVLLKARHLMTDYGSSSSNNLIFRTNAIHSLNCTIYMIFSNPTQDFSHKSKITNKISSNTCNIRLFVIKYNCNIKITLKKHIKGDNLWITQHTSNSQMRQ